MGERQCSRDYCYVKIAGKRANHGDREGLQADRCFASFNNYLFAPKEKAKKKKNVQEKCERNAAKY